jgi:outer membrane lipoprotein carrier protein
MNLRWVRVFSVVAAGFALAVLSAPVEATASEANSEDSGLRARLDDIDRRAGEVRDLTARFEQQKFTALLKKPLVSSGRVRMKGPVVRWDTEVPEPAVLHSDGREIRMFYPRQHVVEVYPIDKRITDLAASPLPRLAALREHFRIDAAGSATKGASGGGGGGNDGSKIDRVSIRLTPTDAFLKEHVDQVRVVLDAAAACVVSVEVDDADGDRTVIRFGDVKLNAGLKDADVGLAVPPGTKESRPLEGVQGDPPEPPKGQGTKHPAGRGRTE